MDKKILSMLSISQGAGHLVTGDGKSEKALQKGQAKLVLIAEDASVNTKAKFSNKALFYETPFYEIGKMDELSKAVGKSGRAVFVITSQNLADKIISMINTN